MTSEAQIQQARMTVRNLSRDFLTERKWQNLGGSMKVELWGHPTSGIWLRLEHAIEVAMAEDRLQPVQDATAEATT